jgi:hypothetical protein
LIPFQNTLPYERIGHDLYIHQCPFCGQDSVLLPWKEGDLQTVQDKVKKRLVMPCCHENLMIVDADEDYLLADRPIRINTNIK